MKALTICQPYASAIIHGPKRVENRPQLYSYRGRFLVHAGKSKKMLGTLTMDQKIDFFGFIGDEDVPMEFGAIIGSVEIYECVTIEEHNRNDGGTVSLPDPWAFGPWCLMLRDPRPLPKPIPYRGCLGMFNIPDSILPPGFE